MPSEAARQGKTILLADDDAAVRRMTEKVLERAGYDVLAAGTGAEALEMLGTAGTADLLMTDVIMPGMNGRDLAAEVQRIRPGMKVIFLSGYTDETITPHGVLPAGVNYIEKPFSHDVMIETVRKVLGEE